MRWKVLPDLTGTVCAARHEILAGAVASRAVVAPEEEDSREVNFAMCLLFLGGFRCI